MFNVCRLFTFTANEPHLVCCNPASFHIECWNETRCSVDHLPTCWVTGSSHLSFCQSLSTTSTRCGWSCLVPVIAKGFRLCLPGMFDNWDDLNLHRSVVTFEIHKVGCMFSSVNGLDSSVDHSLCIRSGQFDVCGTFDFTCRVDHNFTSYVINFCQTRSGKDDLTCSNSISCHWFKTWFSNVILFIRQKLFGICPSKGA